VRNQSASCNGGRRGLVTYIDPLVRKTRRHGGTLFFRIAEERRELLDGGHGDVPAVVAGQKGLAVSACDSSRSSGTYLALQVEEEDSRRHCGGVVDRSTYVVDSV
jgi:hypothetical protein